MSEVNSICIALQVEDKIVDLKIPKNLTIQSLKRLLIDALKNINISLPENFDIQVSNKPIKLNQSVRLDRYPIADGDQLIVVELK